MGLFDMFKKKDSSGTVEHSVPLMQTEKAEAELTEEQIEAVRRKIEKRTVQTAYRLSVNMERKPGLTDTKFGGVPYWSSDKTYPADESGGPLMLLAQLNMQDFAGDERLPDKGLLQFYIAADDLYGLDFDVPDGQKNFRVVYHADIDEAVTPEGVLALGIRVSSDMKDGEEIYFPVEGEYAVDVKKSEVSMGVSDYRYEDLMHQAAKELGIKPAENQAPWEIMPEEVYNQEAARNEGHWVMGYPYFTQDDPRRYQDLKAYDTMLFQMDSDFTKDSGARIMWGDMGVANFFMKHEDLKRKDFSKVLYNWDCG